MKKTNNKNSGRKELNERRLQMREMHKGTRNGFGNGIKNIPYDYNPTFVHQDHIHPRHKRVC